MGLAAASHRTHSRDLPGYWHFLHAHLCTSASGRFRSMQDGSPRKCSCSTPEPSPKLEGAGGV